MSINTTGTRASVHCARPNQVSVTPSTTLLTISATSIDGCYLQVSVNPNDSAQQYGVVNVPNCGSNSTNVAFQPVRQSVYILQHKHERFIPYCLGFLLVLATEPEQFCPRFL